MNTLEQLRSKHAGKLNGEWYTFDSCPKCGGSTCSMKIRLDDTLGGMNCWREPESNKEVTADIKGGAPQAPRKPPARGLTVAQYAALKNLPVDFLKSLGVVDGMSRGVSSVRFPYFTPDGKAAGFKHRKAASLKDYDQATAWHGHIKGCDLYGTNRFAEPPESIVIVEGESCTDTAWYLGISAVGVSGKGNWRREMASLPIFKRAEANKQIYVVQEPDAEEFANEICDSFAKESVRVIILDEKDTSELWLSCTGDKQSFAMAWEGATTFAGTRERSWRKRFRSLAELKSPPPRELIKGFLIEGLNLNAAFSCVGKTWVTMSQACALRTGRKFAGSFEVPERVPVIYLMAEQGSGSVYRRAERLRMPLHGDEELLFHTLSHGVITLNDKDLLKAVRDLRPVVFIDTAVRFAHVQDENSASQNNSGLYTHLAELMSAGALAVVANHHVTKASQRGGGLLSLEDVRGSGDIIAMCDIVWMIQTYRGPSNTTEYAAKSKELTRILLHNEKPREDLSINRSPFVLVGRPNIDRDGDFGLLDETVKEPGIVDPRGARMAEAARANPKITNAALADLVKCSPNDVVEMMAREGFRRQGTNKGPWVETARLPMEGEEEGAEEVF